MRRIVLVGLAIILLLAVIAAGANTSRSTVQAAIRPPQIDPFSLMATAKNLPSQELLTLKMWPDNGSSVTDPGLWSRPLKELPAHSFKSKHQAAIPSSP
jgi:hypothetical protein